MKKLSILILLVFSISAAFAQVDRTKAPQPGPATKLNLGEYTKFELKNGLKVIVVENHKLPVVSYSLTLDLDPIYEGDKAGYTSFAGDLLRKGTTTKTKEQIDETIDFIGATLSTHSGGIYARSLKKHSEQLLDVMTDVLYNPTFPQEELDKMVKQTLTGIKSEKDDPASISKNINSALMFGKNSAYGELISEKTIESITIEDCKNYYNTYFKPNVAYLVIVGDITVKEAKKVVKKHFANWNAGDVPTNNFVSPKGFDKPVYAMANKDGANQAYITVAYPLDIKPGTPDALKASVMNQIFGGSGFSARLMKNLREDKAWTYGAYSSLNTDEHMGYFKMASNVRGNIADSAFVEVRKEMEKIITEDVNQEDLQLVKNAMAGSFGRSLEDPATLARFAVNIDKYKLPADYYETYMERLEAVSVADIKDMARKYMQPEKALYLAVGDVSVIEPLMQKLAGDAKVNEFDFYAEKVVRTGLPKDLTAEKVIMNYVNALGGKEKLSSVQDVSIKASMTIQGMELALNSYQKAPNKISIETLMGPNVLSKQVFDGEKGSMTMQGQKQELMGDMLEEMKYSAVIFPELSYKELGYTLELTGKDKIEGKDVYKVIITSPSSKAKTAYFDVTTGLKVKEIAVLPQGSSTTIYSEYKEIDGIKFPVSISQSMGPQMVNLQVSSVEVNKGINDSVFNN